MKLNALFFTLLLGALGFAQGQTPAPEAKSQPTPATESPKGNRVKDPTKSVDGDVSFIQALPSPATKVSKTAPGKDPNMNADGSVSLAAGRLEGVVAEIERRIRFWTPKPGGGDWTMPNILYGPDAQDAAVPGALTLRDVSPLQALTLAAAAAGCTLEPINATKEDLDFQNGPPAIIGYRIVRDKEAWWQRASGAHGTPYRGNQSAAKGPDTVRATLGDVPVPPGYGTNVPVPVPPGYSPGANNPSQGNGAGSNNWSTPGKEASSAPWTDDLLLAAKRESNRSFVRVYALGSILNGTKEEIAMKEKNFDELISTALEKSISEPDSAGNKGSGAGSIGTSKSGTPMPELSFHLELKALIVKGTAAQHEIIEQVIKALKENETHSAPQGQ